MRMILFGATGMVGEGVLRLCLRQALVDEALVIGRRPCRITDPRLSEIVHADLFTYTAVEDRLAGYDACFFCLGTSSVGKDAATYERITYDLTMAAARVLARLNPRMTFCYVSGEGTDSTEGGRIRWARVKGRTENDLLRLPFKAAYNFRPGFINPLPGQEHAYRISKAVAPLYPLIHRVLPRHVCTMEELALAMLQVSTEGYPSRTLENTDIAAAARMFTDRQSARR